MGARVLMIRLSSLGDVVLATSAVEALAEARPDAEIDVLTKPQFAEVFAGNPHVRQIKTWGEGESPFEVAARLKAEKYDFVADLHGNLRTRLLRPLLGGRWSVYDKGALKRRAALFLRARKLLEGAPHVTARYAAALAPLGVKSPGIPRIYIDANQLAALSERLTGMGWDGTRQLVALAPGAAWPTKAWPKENWGIVANLVRYAGALPLIVGGAADRELGEEVLGGMEGLNLAGETSIMGTASALSLSAVLVSNDSAPLHISDSVGTPVVAIFGPTVAGFGFSPIGPRDRIVQREEECRPCSLHGGPKCPLGHFRCLAQIDPSEVMGSLYPLLEARK